MSVTPQQMQALQAMSRLGTSAGVTGLQPVSSALGAYQGLQSGTAQGDVAAAANLARLANQTGLTQALGGTGSTMSGINTGATGALDALTIAQGLQRGGVQGYGSALGAGLQGAGLLESNPALTTAGGYVMAPLAVYNAIKNWQSGNTGSDALQGAEAGAAVGSIFPGFGTLIGGAIGAGVGALSSAFGGGRPDPETQTWNQMAQAINQNPNVANYLSPAQAYQGLAGVMDAKNNSLGHSQPIEQVFGRMGEQNMMDQMTNYINQQVQAGKITPGESVADQWSKTINPWLQSKGAGIANQNTAQGTPEGAALTGDIQSLIGSWESGQLTPQTQVGISGQTIGGLQNFAGPINLTPQQLAAIPTAANTTYQTTVGPQQNAQQATPQSIQGVTINRAQGGPMKRKQMDRAGISEALQQILEAPPFNLRIPPEREHFQYGGYVDYVGNYDPTTGTTSNLMYDTGTSVAPMPALTPSDITQGSSTLTDLGSSPAPGGSSGNLTNADVAAALQASVPADYQPSTPGDPSISAQLQTAWKNLTGQGAGGIGGAIKDWASLSPLASLFIHPKTNLNPPSAAPGMTQGAGKPKPSTFSRTQTTPTSLTSGTNVTPSATGAGGMPTSLADWYTYGSRPEASFFQNNMVPLNTGTGIATGQARGGRQGGLDSLGGNYGMPEFDSSVQHFAQGPGDGTSDHIPAQLSDGEYVMDAGTVSLLGNGSNKAGAQRLDQLRQNIRKQAAGPMAKGKQFMKAKPPQAYMGRKR